MQGKILDLKNTTITYFKQKHKNLRHLWSFWPWNPSIYVSPQGRDIPI